MRISAKREYACLAMLFLAARDRTREPARLREIAAAYDIPQRFLVQIMLDLKAAGLVGSTRGVGGGYHLARPADAITLHDVTAAVEPVDPLFDDDAAAPTPGRRVLRTIWGEAAEREREFLAKVTLSELVGRAAVEDMYFI